LLKKSLLLCSKWFDSLIFVRWGGIGDDGCSESSGTAVLRL
jgi:hypothetical protein